MTKWAGEESTNLVRLRQVVVLLWTKTNEVMLSFLVRSEHLYIDFYVFSSMSIVLTSTIAGSRDRVRVLLHLAERLDFFSLPCLSHESLESPFTDHHTLMQPLVTRAIGTRTSAHYFTQAADIVHTHTAQFRRPTSLACTLRFTHNMPCLRICNHNGLRGWRRGKSRRIHTK